VIYYQYKTDQARRTLRGIDEQAARAVAGLAPVKRNRFIALNGAVKSVNRELEQKARDLAGLKGCGGNSSPCPGAALALSRTQRTISRAVTCSSLSFEVKAVYCVSATLASEAQQPSWSSQIACGYLMAVQASPGWRRSRP
jgi:hypothetical protein